jgi:hypothetical protein
MFKIKDRDYVNLSTDQGVRSWTVTVNRAGHVRSWPVTVNRAGHVTYWL